jgi:hypothetical protein
MLVHLRTFSPGDADLLGETGMRRVVRLAIERARAYGVTNPAMLRLYVELMFMFGSFFDTDPLHPWAGEILRDPALAGEVERTRLLYDAMCQYQDAVAGPDRELALQVLRDLSAPPPAGFAADSSQLASEIQRAILRIHSRRGSYLGAPRLQQLVHDAAETARRHALVAAPDVILVALLRFMLGHGFAVDPLCPWAIDAVGDGSPEGVRMRSRRLSQGFQSFLEQVLAREARRYANDPS